MKEKIKYYEDYADDEDDVLEEGQIRLKFRLIKGKVNRNPSDFALIINKTYVTEDGAFIRIVCGSPEEFNTFSNFCRQHLGNFPSKSPYIYIPKDVLVPQPLKKNKSLFK